MKTRLWMVINALFLAAFLFSVAVQYNDPDPLRWVAIYGLAALACFFEMRRRTPFLLPLGTGLAAAIWAASIAPQISGDIHLGDLVAEFEMKNADVELAREMGGLMIVTTWMFVVAAVAYIREKKLATRRMLRHTIATLAYRAAKAVDNAPPTFADFKASVSSRTPLEIVAHMGDLMQWANGLAEGRYEWNEHALGTWDAEVDRFFMQLGALDQRLSLNRPSWSDDVIFQGPVADALTHTGQVNMLRRMAGSPVKGESYARADIAIGRTGRDQSAQRVEFD